MPSKFETLLVAAVAGPLEVVGADLLTDLLMKIEPLEARRTVLLSLYPAVDVQLEELASKSKTKLDNAFVGAIKAAIEQAADQSDVTLPNSDED